MNANDIQEFRYSVTDVVFEDVENAPVPNEHQALFDEYCEEIDILPVSTPMWRSSSSCGYKSCMLEKNRHKAYTKSLLCSGDEKKVQVGIEAMLHQLGRHYESFHMKKYMQDCRANLERMRTMKSSKLSLKLLEEKEFYGEIEENNTDETLDNV